MPFEQLAIDLKKRIDNCITYGMFAHHQLYENIIPSPDAFVSFLYNLKNPIDKMKDLYDSAISDAEELRKQNAKNIKIASKRFKEIQDLKAERFKTIQDLKAEIREKDVKIFDLEAQVKKLQLSQGFTPELQALFDEIKVDTSHLQPIPVCAGVNITSQPSITPMFDANLVANLENVATGLKRTHDVTNSVSNADSAAASPDVEQQYQSNKKSRPTVESN